MDKLEGIYNMESMDAMNVSDKIYYWFNGRDGRADRVKNIYSTHPLTQVRRTHTQHGIDGRDDYIAG